MLSPVSASSSVFSRFKRHPSEIASQPSTAALASPAARDFPAASLTPVPEHTRLVQSHKRDSKRDSSSGTIRSLPSSVQDLRRSVSLRSNKPRSHRSHVSATHLASTDFDLAAEGPGPASPSLRRTSLAVSTPAYTQARTLSRGSMIAGGDANKRHTPDRPGVSTQASFGRDGNMNGPALLPAPPVQPMGSHNPLAIYQQIRETSAKRMTTIEYLKRVHEGNVYYFSTLHYTSGSLASLPSMNAHKLGRRATSYLLLGYSLPALLEMNASTPLEFLKSLLALLQEFETYQHLSGSETGSSLSRGRVGQMFKSGIGLGKGGGKGRRASGTTDSLPTDTQGTSLPAPSGSMGPPETAPAVNFSGIEFHHLLTPNLPFDPDFGTTFATLCDTLNETYVSLLGLVTGPEACNMLVGDAFVKADKAIRKILVANILREFEDSSRSGIKSEVAGLQRLVLGGLV